MQYGCYEHEPKSSHANSPEIYRQFRIALLLLLGAIVLVLLVNFFALLVTYVECWALGKATIYYRVPHPVHVCTTMVGFTGLSAHFVARCGKTGRFTRRLREPSLINERFLLKRLSGMALPGACADDIGYIADQALLALRKLDRPARAKNLSAFIDKLGRPQLHKLVGKLQRIRRQQLEIEPNGFFALEATFLSDM